MNLTISTKRVTIVLVLMVMFITVVNLVGQFYKYLPSDGLLFGLLPNLDPGGDGSIVLFDVGGEGTIPTWYSSCALLLCSIPLAVIAAVKRRSGGSHVLHWWALALIFVFLSMDEAVQIHEKVSDILENSFDFGGFLTYAWVVPAGVFLLVFALAYLNFFLHLPARTRWLFLVAGVLYVGGAVGLEMVAARYDDLYGNADPVLNPVYAVLVSVEEFLEMMGVIVFIYALMSYIGTNFKDLHVLVED